MPRGSVRAKRSAVSRRATLGLVGVLIVGALTSVGPAQSQAGAVLAKRDPTVESDPAMAAPPPVPREIPFVVADGTTGAVLAERDGHKRLPMASTLKMLTLLSLLDVLNPNQVVHATYGDVAVSGSRVGLVAGAAYHVRDLYFGMMLASGNDASLALARAAGGQSKTVDLMRATALGLGATETTIVNPDGLDAKGQLSTVHDLALIAMSGMKRHDFASIVGTTWVWFPGALPKKKGAHRQKFEVWTINRFMLHNYRGAIGVKSGYTTHAHNTLVIAARRGARYYIVALLNCKHDPYIYAEALMTWAFKHGAVARSVDQLLPTATPSPSVAAQPSP